jgi:hypothetical protein
MVFGACVLLGCALPAGAQVYKWTDENGKVHYGDKPQGARPATTVKGPAAGPQSGPSGGAASLEECHTITCQGMRADQQKRAAEAEQRKRAPASAQAKPRATPATGPSAAERERAAAMEKCKANRGVDCDKPSGLNPWIQQDRPMTAEQQRAAVAARNERIQRETIERARRDASRRTY